MVRIQLIKWLLSDETPGNRSQEKYTASRPWPYWLRGAVLFSIIFLPLLLLTEGTAFVFAPLFTILSFLWLFLGLGFIGSIFQTLLGSQAWATANHGFVIRCLFVIFYTLVGGLLGALYSKHKKRRGN